MDNGPNMRPSLAHVYHGWEDSQKLIRKALLEFAPIHYILGFSQGYFIVLVNIVLLLLILL